MLSSAAVVLACLLVSAEGYATVRDDRVFASSGKQQTKTSTTSDHSGDMATSVAVQADGSISEVQIQHAAEDEGLSTLGEKDHKVSFAVDSFGSFTATDSIGHNKSLLEKDHLGCTQKGGSCTSDDQCCNIGHKQNNATARTFFCAAVNANRVSYLRDAGDRKYIGVKRCRMTGSVLGDESEANAAIKRTKDEEARKKKEKEAAAKKKQEAKAKTVRGKVEIGAGKVAKGAQRAVDVTVYEARH